MKAEKINFLNFVADIFPVWKLLISTQVCWDVALALRELLEQNTPLVTESLRMYKDVK